MLIRIKHAIKWLNWLRIRLFVRHCVACHQPVHNAGSCRRALCYYASRHSI